MSDKLKIYACSGIGATSTGRFDYWLDNTETISNTQAVNNLLAQINLLYSEAVHLDLSEEETLRRLDNIDELTVCLHFAQRYAANSEELYRAGLVVGSMVKAGAFISSSLDNTERDANLDRLIAEADSAMQRDVEADPEYMAWWQQNVLDLNQVGLTEEQQRIIRDTLRSQRVSGYEENGDLAQYLNNAGEYFLYLYFTSDQLAKLPAVFARKAKVQQNTYEQCKALYVGVYGTEAAMKSTIRSGIQQAFGKTPEQVCNTIYQQYVETGRIGNPAVLVWTVADIIAVVSACLTFVAGIIAAICTCVQNVKIAEIQQVDTAAAVGATPSEDDYPADWNKKKAGTGVNSDIIMYGAAALAVLLLLRK